MIKPVEFILNQRKLAYLYLFDVNTRCGRCIEFFLIVVTLFSVVLVFIESTYESLKTNSFLEWSEIILTVLFTLEYVLRVFSTPRKQHYIKSFFGFIDLITLLPVYFIILIPGMGAAYSTLFRLMRVLRILRMIKLMRYMNSVLDLWSGLVASYRKLLVFFFIIGVIICLFAGAMYAVEGPSYGFTSLPVAFYWAVVTITTVGYGDITPHTPLGQLITSLLILIGYTIIAIPTGVLSAHMTEIVQRKRSSLRRCGHCNYFIDEQAHYCSQCGNKITDVSAIN